MSVPLLSLRDVSLVVEKQKTVRPILENISFDVFPNRVLGILGEGGSGKTVLARAMAGWISSPLSLAGGKILYRSSNILIPEVHRKAIRKIGYIGGDPGNAFDPTMPVGKQITEKLLSVNNEIAKDDARKKVIALLDAVRIPSAARRYDEFPHQYSGGMLQRAVIVDAIVNDPEILICDNIIQPLDVTVAAQIIRLLRELRNRIASGIVFMTTSVPSVAEVADDLLVLSRGRMIERGIPSAIIATPSQAVTRNLVERTPRIWTEAAPPVESPGAELPVLQVIDITRTYHSRDHSSLFGQQAVRAVRGVSFDVYRGDNFGLVGESGCGKSTLSRLLSWIEPPDSGRILFDGKDIAEMSRRERLAMRQGFQLVLQDPYNCLPPHLPVGRSIGLGLTIHGVSRKEIRQRVREVMADVGLPEEDIDRLPVGMSAGQRQRINIARALILEPKLMILDETLSSLDPVEQSQLLGLFEKLQVKHNLTYLYISHDLAMVRRVCTRIAVMYLGKMVEIADTGGIFYDPGHPYTKALLSAVPTLEQKPYRSEECLLDGEPPNPIDIPPGCSFAARCPQALTQCLSSEPILWRRAEGRVAACHVTAPAGQL